MNVETLKLIGYAIVVCFLIGSGWICRGWQEDAEDLAQLGAAQQAIAAFEQKESLVSQAVEKRLAELNANQTVIVREKVKLVDRPVYSNLCLDVDGQLLINSSKARSDATKPAH